MALPIPDEAAMRGAVCFELVMASAASITAQGTKRLTDAAIRVGGRKIGSTRAGSGARYAAPELVLQSGVGAAQPHQNLACGIGQGQRPAIAAKGEAGRRL